MSKFRTKLLLFAGKVPQKEEHIRHDEREEDNDELNDFNKHSRAFLPLYCNIRAEHQNPAAIISKDAFSPSAL